MMSDISYFDFVRINFEHLVLIDFLSLLLILTSFLYFQFSITKNVANKSILNKISLSGANILLFVSIIGLVVQPKFESYKGEELGDELHEVQIITKSSNAEIRFMINQLEDNRESTFILPDAFVALSKGNDSSSRTQFSVNLVSSPSQIPIRIAGNLENDIVALSRNYSLEILGDGFSNQQIEVLNNSNDNYFQKIIYEPPTNTETGLVNPTWDNRINLGEHSVFTARIQLGNKLRTKDVSMKERLTLRFLNPSGQLEEEKEVVDGEEVSFRMTPKIFGLMTYNVELLSNDKVISKEIIAIEVANKAKLKMLILQSSPSFETKQLKNWAGDQHAVIVVNTKLNLKMNLSRLTNVEEKNRKKYRSININESVLAEFDILVIDSRRFNQLKTNNVKAIVNSIDDGLGVIVLMGKEALDTRLPFSGIDKESLTISNVGKENQSILTIELVNSNDIASRNLLSETPISHVANNFQFASEEGNRHVDKNNLITLISNSKKEVLVAQLQKGLGAITYNLLKDTYRLVSNGEKMAHSRFWQHLIENTARSRKNITQWINDDKRLEVGNKEKLCVITNLFDSDLHLSKIRSLSDNNFYKILFNKSPTFENYYCANLWVKNLGWHQLNLNNGKSGEKLFFYVYPKESWLADHQNSKTKNTTRFRSHVNNRQVIKGSKIETPYREIELWIYWMSIILSLSYIWIERKLV